LALAVSLEVGRCVQPGLIPERRVSALVNQILNNRQRTHSCRHHQRSCAIRRLGVDERVLVDQNLDQLKLPSTRGIVQRRPSGAIHLRSTLNQRIE